jgi:probable blue pigment (indigoidine) exporter
MARATDILITAIAPTIWGATYIITTQLLPPGYPLTAAVLRGLPAGLVMLALARQLPFGIWWGRAFILGALNFSIFWAMLFISAYRLPGGVAATVGAVQPLVVIALSRIFMGSPVRALAIVGGIAGMCGVALLVLTPHAALDPIGVIAGLVGAVSMAFGTVFSRHWQPPVSPFAFTAWQMTAGSILLVPAAVLLEPSLPHLTTANWLGFLWFGLIGGALSYLIWFRGLSRLEATSVAPLGFLSPMVAVILGWAILGQSLSGLQIVGLVVVLVSVWISQMAQMKKPAKAPASA